MRRKKRSSLNLSVNAIVVFVLAFAMLGVGLWFVNVIRDRLGETTGDVFDISDLKNPPTSDTPITISQTVTIKSKDSVKLDVGFYNVDTNTATQATIGIKGCVYNSEVYNNDGELISGSASEEVPANKLPAITSPISDVDANTGKGFPITMKDRGLTPGPIYVCNLCVYEKGAACDPRDDNYDPDKVYEENSGSFFLEISS